LNNTAITTLANTLVNKKFRDCSRHFVTIGIDLVILWLGSHIHHHHHRGRLRI